MNEYGSQFEILALKVFFQSISMPWLNPHSDKPPFLYWTYFCISMFLLFALL